eukprot:1155977-Pelagomonas_calceolata.AAC.6
MYIALYKPGAGRLGAAGGRHTGGLAWGWVCFWGAMQEVKCFGTLRPCKPGAGRLGAAGGRCTCGWLGCECMLEEAKQMERFGRLPWHEDARYLGAAGGWCAGGWL